MIEEVKYKAFQELVKYPDDLMRELAQDITLLEKIELAYNDLAFEIDRNKYQVENRETFRKYLVDRLDYVVFAVADLVKYHNENFVEWLAKYGAESYTKIFEGVKQRLMEIGRSATEYKEGLLEIGNSKMEPSELKPKSEKKLKWKGDQKQLAELFISLENLGWIEPLQDGERLATCRNICNLFDITSTKRKRNSDEVKSFAEIMKPDTDKKTKAKTYSKVFTSHYKKRFSKIEKRG